MTLSREAIFTANDFAFRSINAQRRLDDLPELTSKNFNPRMSIRTNGSLEFVWVDLLQARNGIVGGCNLEFFNHNFKVE